MKTALRNFSMGLVLGTSALGGPGLYAQTSLLLQGFDERLTKLLHLCHR